ncbi:MAG TPA: tetratricopeptide repeat protein [Thermoanaerobaculia bacterium]|nr:tetratricopeptide repeat protein [Thermoanaerobaculia bacterium]
MNEWHVERELLGRFLRAEATREEARRVVQHLLSGCPQCLESARQASSQGAVAQEPNAHDEVFQRALRFGAEQEQRLAVEKLRGWGQWAALAPLQPQVRFAVVENDVRFQNWGLYVRLLEASRLYMRTEPAEAVDVVRLAIVVAEHLDAAVVGAKRIADLRAAAWAALGNVKRLASDFEGSRRAFNEAWRISEEGTGEPVEAAHILSLEAAYIRDMGEFETAEAALEEALELYERVGDPHQQGRTLLKMGNAIGYGNPERALSHIQRGLALIDPAREPRLDLCAQHDLAWFLNDSGRPEEALAVLERARPLYNQFPDEWTQLRLHWLEGRIARNLGDLAEAEDIYKQLWEEFQARDLHHELVLLSIDLAELLVLKGEPERAAGLVEQCYPILKTWGLHNDALAAWLVFRDALASRQVGSVFSRMRDYFRRHWVKPAALG